MVVLLSTIFIPSFYVIMSIYFSLHSISACTQLEAAPQVATDNKIELFPKVALSRPDGAQPLQIAMQSSQMGLSIGSGWIGSSCGNLSEVLFLFHSVVAH